MDRLPVLAALATLLLTASGCSSPSAGPSGTTGPNPPATGKAVNVTVDYSCTARPGGVVGVGGPDSATIAGCVLTTLTGKARYVKEDVPSGCGVSYFNNDGDQLSDGAPTVGDTFDAGVSFDLGCGPSAPTATGKVTFEPL